MNTLRTILPLLLAFMLSFGMATQAQTIRYVMPEAAGKADGSSWDNASDDLQLMINESAGGDEIWVSAGLYLPNRPINDIDNVDPGNRDNAFLITNPIKLYGGFAGYETRLDQRNLALNETVLSGDLDGKGSSAAGNMYHVLVLIRAGNAEVSDLSLRHGYADVVYESTIVDVRGTINGVGKHQGGGLFIDRSPAKFTNVTVAESTALQGGGAYIRQSAAMFDNCSFIGNRAWDVHSEPGLSGHGGGVYVTGAGGDHSTIVRFSNIRVSGNEAESQGAGIMLGPFSNTVITNALVSGNKAERDGPGIYLANAYVAWMTNLTIAGNSSELGSTGLYGHSYSLSDHNFRAYLRNSIVYNNSSEGIDQEPNDELGEFFVSNSIIEGGYTGAGNIDADPLFVSVAMPVATPTLAGDYRLSIGSPAIDAGDNAWFDSGGDPDLSSVTTDLDGNARQFAGGQVDMGAYEFEHPPFRPFITTWKTNNLGGPGNEITIPIEGDGYDMAIDWGDGTSTTWQDGDDPAGLTHTYASAGTYDVSITGDFPRIYFNNRPGRLKILDVKQWGDVAWTSMGSAFWGAENLVITATDAPDLSNVTSLSNMFRNAVSMNSPVGHWDISNVRYLNGTFRGATSFNQDVSAWDVSNVWDMVYLFGGATAFNQPLNWASGFSTENFVIMSYMLVGASSFDQDLGGWDISRISNMNQALNNTGISMANYDATLSAWAAQPDVRSYMVLGANGLRYCASEADRQWLITEKNWEISGDLRAADCTIAAPVLVAPADGSSGVALPVTLEWEPVEGAASYFIQVIEAGGNFGAPLFTAISTAVTNEVNSFQPNTAYEWRVQAIVDGVPTAWSEIWAFNTELAPVPGISFSDAEFVYDGEPKSVLLTGDLPEGVTVTYTGNEQTEAGVYTVTADIDGGGNYADEELTATLTIARAPSVITAAAVQTHTYNGGFKLVEATLNHSEMDLQYEPADRFTDVGEYDVVVSVAQSANYEAASAEVQVVIVAGQQTGLQMASRIVEYDGEVHSLFVTGAAADATVAYEGNDQTDAGTYEVTATVTRPGYEPAVLNATLTITPRNMAITIGEHQKVYGEPDPDTYSYAVTSGSLVDGDEPTGTFEREPGENVQIYPVRRGTFTFGNNYNLIVNQGYLRIVRAPSVITADPVQVFTYNGSLHQVTASLNHDQAPLIYTPVERGYTDVGEYEISIRVNQSTNYEAANIVVTQIIEPDGQSEDLVMPSRTVTYDGTAHSLVVENLPAGASVTYTGNAQTNAGTYPVQALVQQTGYADVELTGTLVINRATAVITADPVQTYTYTGSEIGVEATLNHNETGFNYSPVSGYIDPGTYNITVSANQTANYTAASRAIVLRILPVGAMELPSRTVVYTGAVHELEMANLPAGASVVYGNNGHVDVGTYTVTATVSLPGEDDQVFEATLTITRATPVITTEAIQEHTYDGTLKTVVASLSHDEIELDYLPASGYTLPGTYDITVRAMQTANYTTAFRNVQLVIHPISAAGDYTMPPRTVVYDGQPHSLEVENLPADASVVYSGNGAVDAGTYTVTATVTRPGYTEEQVAGVLTITRAPSVITATPMQSYTYDGTPKSVIATLNHDEAALAFAPAQSFTAVGTYTVTVSVPQSDNYEAASASVTLAISEAQTGDLQFSGQTVTYNGDPHYLGVSNLPTGATVVYTNNGQVDVGSYTVTATVTLADNSTQVLEALLVIEKATLTGISFDNATFAYDGTPKSLAITGTLPAGVTASYANNSRTAAGTQTVTATLAGANYETLELQAQLTITPATITGISLADATFGYDGSPKSLAVTGTLPAGVTASYANNSRTAAGTQTVTATLAGANYETLELQAELTITPATITGISLADATFGYDGTPKSLSVTGTLPDGVTASYANNSRTAAGTQTVTATVAGANYETLELQAELTITPVAITGISLADATFGYDGTPKSLAVTGTLPDGVTVSYANNSRTETGTQTVTATVAGANYETLELQAELTITPVAITGISLADATFGYDGTPKSLAVTGTLPDGVTVSYANNSRTAVGTQIVTATLAGANYATLELQAQLTITPGTRQITFPPIPATVYGEDEFAVGATTDSGEDIIYTSSNENVVVIENGVIRIVGVGTATITATVPANPNYSNTPVATQPITVTKATQTISFAEVGELRRDAGTVSLSVSSSSGLPVSLSLDDPQVVSLNGTSLDVLRLGTVRITATQPGNENYEAATPVTITVRVVDPEAPVRIHKAVSPNGDGINEFLMIEGIRDYAENRVTIFNKNGTIVYEVNGYDNDSRAFRGRGSAGIRLPAGTYYCIVEVRDGNGWKHVTGYFVMRY